MIYFDKYGLENCKIVLIELVDATILDEIRARETYYIHSLQCVNRRPSIRDRNEYMEQYKIENHDRMKERDKLYRERVKDKRKEKYNCNCGSCIEIIEKARHERSIKHQSYIKSLEN